jgi:hypothetical protein
MYFSELSRVSKSLAPPKFTAGELSSSERSLGPSTSLSVTDKFKVKFKSKDKDKTTVKINAKSAIDPNCVPAEVFEMGITFDPAKSAVPKTKGIRRTDDDAECCLIIFFADGNRERKSRAAFAEMHNHKVFRLLSLSLSL